MFKQMESHNVILFQVMAVMMIIGSMLTIGVANLSEIFALMQEIIDNTDVIVGMVIMAVTISIAVYIGVWIKKLLNSTMTGK